MIYDFTKFLFTKVYINNFEEIDKKHVYEALNLTALDYGASDEEDMRNLIFNITHNYNQLGCSCIDLEEYCMKINIVKIF